MYKLEKPKVLLWPVTVDVPISGGKTRQHRFHLEYEYLDQDEIDALWAQCKDDIEFLCRVVKGFGDDLGDEDGRPLPFSVDNCRKLARRNYIRKGMIRGFNEMTWGAPEKNSERPPAIGPEAAS